MATISLLAMEEKEKQIKNSILYLAPMAVSSVLPLISMPIFTRLLTKEDYGAIALAQIYASFVSGLSNLGLPVVYERNFFQYREQRSIAQLLYSTLGFVISAFLLCAFFTYFLRSYFSKWIIGSSVYGDLLFWAFCATGIVSIKNYYLTYFKNTENARSFVWYTIDESILGIIFSLFWVAYLRVGVIGLIWGQLMASLIILLILIFTFLKLHPPAFNREILKDSLRLSLPLTPKSFIGVIGTQFDKYMIGLLNTVGGVGIYSIGQKIAYTVFSCMTALQNTYSPQVYKRMFDEAEKGGKSIGSYLTPFVYYSIAVALLVSLFSEELIIILTPPSYHGAIEIVIILSMFYGSMFFGKQPQLMFAQKTYIISILSMLNIILNILINVPFIMKWGVIRAAWGTLTAGLISGAIHFVISQKYYNIKWEYKKIISIFLLFFVSSILIITMRSISISYPFRFAVKCGSIISFLFIGISIKAINIENINLLRKVISLRQIPSKK